MRDRFRAIRVSPVAGDPTSAELRPGSPWTRTLTDLGVRSLLRVSVRIKDEPIGRISFASDRPCAYDEDDVILATRIAENVALALAHERLAEEGRRAAQAQERARLLEEHVHTLVEELEVRTVWIQTGCVHRRSRVPRGQFYSMLRRHGLTDARR